MENKNILLSIEAVSNGYLLTATNILQDNKLIIAKDLEELNNLFLFEAKNLISVSTIKEELKEFEEEESGVNDL